VGRFDLTGDCRFSPRVQPPPHASVLLGCAAANAYETADNVRGDDKELARSVVCLIEMAKAALDAVLVRGEGCHRA
jgi:hypothetical protein